MTDLYNNYFTSLRKGDQNHGGPVDTMQTGFQC